MRRIGQYEIVGEVGKGAMGIVFRAFDPIIHRPVAIKVVRLPEDAGRTQREHYRERIRREIRSVGRLSHPGIVTIYYSGEDPEGFPYIAMEFVEGRTLEELLDSSPFQQAVALPLIHQISAGLDYAHGKGVIHRDIKPANIMVCADGTVKIMDFGIAKAAEEMTLTETGFTPGTPLYMSPEQVRAEPLDGRSDQFSLAVIAYRMATGSKPFAPGNIAALFQKILNEPAPTPSSVFTALPSQVDAVFAKALAKQPQQRYATCLDFARALESAWGPVSPIQTARVKVNPKDGLKYVWIPPGTFTMGCSEGDAECSAHEKPAHEVTITKGFWIGQTPVTQAPYERVMGQNPSHFKGAERPVETVSWMEAQKYCETVGMRLPTEAEWEYAARAGSQESRYGAVDEVAWYGGQETRPVGQKQPNAWGLYDTLGNVYEWVADWYGDQYYASSPRQDPQGPKGGQYRVVRGGSWYYDSQYVRVSFRAGNVPTLRNFGIGFRCAGELR